MRHVLHIVTVVLCRFGKIVGMMLRAGNKSLLVTRKAATERVPARVDDFGIWQYDMDEAHMHEISAGLVGKEGAVSFSVAAGQLQIFFTQCGPRIAAGIGR